MNSSYVVMLSRQQKKEEKETPILLQYNETGDNDTFLDVLSLKMKYLMVFMYSIAMECGE